MKTENCRICDAKIKEFMTFGPMPIANGFLNAQDVANEYFFELAPAFCDSCYMFQIVEQPDPEKMFHENYAFFSSTSRYMQEHFKGFAHNVIDNFFKGKEDPFVVELGSNDGIMLKHFKDQDIKHLGVEPSSNVANVAREQGINTISEFFGQDLAEKIKAEYGPANAILAANVMCHIPDLNSVFAGAQALLKPQGVLIFEDPYLGDMVEKTSYDQIYDEHVFIFSATSVSEVCKRHGLELFDAQPQITHGGSMRYLICPEGQRKITDNVKSVLAKEKAQGLDTAATYETFKANCEKSKTGLIEQLNDLKSKNLRIVGYGATSKSTTVMNYCGITADHIEFISDTTPIKQGKLTPGTHIPVKHYQDFVDNPPDVALLFAWNHAKEILEKETDFTSNGGKWLVYVPNVKMIEAA